jgi:hypothetical protein
MPFMLSVTNKLFTLNIVMLNVIMLSVVMLNVVAPPHNVINYHVKKPYCTGPQKEQYENVIMPPFQLSFKKNFKCYFVSHGPIQQSYGML